MFFKFKHCLSESVKCWRNRIGFFINLFVVNFSFCILVLAIFTLLQFFNLLHDARILNPYQCANNVLYLYVSKAKKSLCAQKQTISTSRISKTILIHCIIFKKKEKKNWDTSYWKVEIPQWNIPSIWFISIVTKQPHWLRFPLWAYAKFSQISTNISLIWWKLFLKLDFLCLS